MFHRLWISALLILQAAVTFGAGPTAGNSSPTPIDATSSAAPGIFYDSSTTNAWAIKGKVTFIAHEGIFVRCGRNPDPGQRKPKEGEIVFIRDPFPDLATFKDLKIGSEVVRQGFSIGMVQNKVGHGVPTEVRGFELR